MHTPRAPLVLIVIALMGSGSASAHAQTEPGALDRRAVDEIVATWQARPEERAFDAIGWAPSLSRARALAARHHRLLFMFTYDGTSLTCYRC